jgi:hypothetical protein
MAPGLASEDTEDELEERRREGEKSISGPQLPLFAQPKPPRSSKSGSSPSRGPVLMILGCGDGGSNMEFKEELLLAEGLGVRETLDAEVGVFLSSATAASPGAGTSPRPAKATNLFAGCANLRIVGGVSAETCSGGTGSAPFESGAEPPATGTTPAPLTGPASGGNIGAVAKELADSPGLSETAFWPIVSIPLVPLTPYLCAGP